ncbi:NAD-glutamate dehydrogenase [Aliikangiella coralliicola]|uniref:NAD-glutamate dehydrogenase n=1 Tax=Aliikangiella coralliicola TaxID=2592383 RepID=A0A545TWD0_9GAMM|nr:NAD-glutamate dehydrogenase [Aliikangiella coralliicola]TQV81514.1 NAD-glutamate dehydrogenase [Aliikangiella coralliicola]
MSIEQKTHDTILFKNVVKLIQSKFSKKQAELVSQFAHYFCAGISSIDFEYKNANELYAPIVSLWNYMQACSEECDVRVYTPELETHGWQSRHTIIELVHKDMPFLVDSVRMELNRLGINIHLHIHMPMTITRDKDSNISAIARPDPEKDDDDVTPMYLEIDRQLDKSELELIKSNLEEILSDVRVTVSDWEKMKKKLNQVIGRLDKLPKKLQNAKNKECRDFLEWISGNHFTLLGYTYYELNNDKNDLRLVPQKRASLGLKTKQHWSPKAYKLSDLPAGARNLILNTENLLVLTKLSAISRVHRPAHIDYIGVKRVNEKGEIIGEDRFIGLYTSAAYNLNPMSIPVLRQKIHAVQERSGFTKQEHDLKVLKNILETYPRDELFQTNVDKLYETTIGILQIQERPIIRLFARRDPYGRFFACLVYVPREIYTTRIRIKITEILKSAFGAISEPQFTTTFSESILARLHFIIPVENAEAIKYDVKEIEKDLYQATRSWEDNLNEVLLSEFGEAEGKRLFQRYSDRFPAGYQDESIIQTAVLDIKHMEALTDEKALSMLLYRSQEDGHGNIRFKLFYRDQPKPLSDVMPMLENMGLNIIGETPYRVKPAAGSVRWISDFEMQHPAGIDLDLELVKDKFQEAFSRIWFDDAENDGFNRLVLSASLNWRETAMLRAYAKYMWQIGSSFSQSYVEETLAAYPEIAKLLVVYFFQKFDPVSKQSERVEKELRDRIIGELDEVANLDQDRILHRYLEMIDATIRTNFFQLDENGESKNYISLKLKPSQISDIPKPAPMFEIFVYSPRVEGVHLRGGKVARGGLRWSDRREDFRTEILGLVKAQQVKNSVIVPVGAKGGFVCKRSLAGLSREEFMAEGIACYETFISALLDITDNLIDGKLVPPDRVVRHDEDDPYLVVAADKGTATFSDIANGISEKYGFWLGDAFASGGSIGYDHKKMGITAKGAWESVKRHFMEMGIDSQNEDFTAVGIGDMSGDVFGNGMLCSRHIKLVAAFNHMHIFIDPNPDSEKSYVERERLFKLPRSSWEDYNTKLISAGGGIFSRSSKAIPLSEEIQKLLGIEEQSLTPNQLISAILKAEVDLLWNGGIGTYIKAGSETHSDVGDRANDGLRINASELRCGIIGEGGNLGVTQLARIEYMRRGGRGNSDFIDNAGGVNCSDNEVNIKILLNQIVATGDMTEKQRNKLLLSMTDEVGEIVLRENFLQAQSISVSEERSEKMVKELMRFIHWLEREERLDRELEFLPSDEELIERLAQGEGLTRAEIAVLTAYGKMVLKEELCSPEVANEPFYKDVLVNYFPKPIRRKYAGETQEHPLKDEIIAMCLANEMVDYLGSNFAFRAMDETGATPADVATCFTLAKEIYDMPAMWKQIEALDHSIPASIKHNMIYQTQRMVRRCTRWFLRHRRKNLAIQEGIEYFKDGVVELQKTIHKALDKVENDGIKEDINSWVDHGVPKKLAERICYLSTMFSALDIVEMSKLTGLNISMVAEVYFKLGAKLELHWFLEQINLQAVDNHWQAFARASFREDLDWQQRSLTVAVLHMSHKETSAEERIISWIIENSSLLSRWQQMLADFRASKRHEFAKFSVALRELLILVQSSVRAAAIAREEDLGTIKKS